MRRSLRCTTVSWAGILWHRLVIESTTTCYGCDRLPHMSLISCCLDITISLSLGSSSALDQLTGEMVAIKKMTDVFSHVSETKRTLREVVHQLFVVVASYLLDAAATPSALLQTRECTLDSQCASSAGDLTICFWSSLNDSSCRTVISSRISSSSQK